jgi:hypothetical protein
MTPGSGSVSTITDWVPITANDGHDGPGIKRPLGGKVMGPYVQQDKLKMQGLAFVDQQGNPILYFPASPVKPNIHALNGYAAAGMTGSLYNVLDNEIFFRAQGESTNTNAIQAIEMLLGDIDHNGQIDAGETEATTGPFILWSAGPDGIFGPARATALTAQQAKSTYDDVTNFR